MTEIPATPRFSLPLLAQGQAQKEVTHNEALILLDALLHAVVEGGPLNVPPGGPLEGQCWLVGAAPGGAWASEAGAVAIWTAGGWRFAAPRAGMRALRSTDGAWLRCDGAGWVEPATIAAPTGGATVDSEARSAMFALILLLEAQGLLISG